MQHDFSRLKYQFPYYYRQSPYCIVPVCHFKFEFAEAVRIACSSLKPDLIALELPASLTPHFLEAVKRLPEISVILSHYENTAEPYYFLVEPADPFVEAARYAIEHSVPLVCIDKEVTAFQMVYDPVPDPYTIKTIGHKEYYEAYRAVPNKNVSDEQTSREQTMAHKLTQSKEHFTASNILVCCGMAHLSGLLEALKKPAVLPFEAIRRPQIQIFNVHPDSIKEVLYQYPFLSSLYERTRKEVPRDIDLHQFTVRKQGKLLTINDLTDYFRPTNSEEEALEAAQKWAARRVFSPFVSVEQRKNLKTSDEIMRSDPQFIIDRQKVALKLYECAALHYNQDTGDSVEKWQKRVFMKFARNYAVIQGLLLPDFYHLLVAARACVDDNFGYAFWRLGSFYPWQREISDKPTIHVSGEDLMLGMRKIRFQRFIPRKRQRWNLVPMKKRPREKIPGEWLQSYDGDMICSYPPEDIEIENYSGFLKNKASRMLSIEKKRTEPFSTSLLDGIDIRETIRNFHEKKLYVQEYGKAGGDVGAVVVIFEEDGPEQKFPWLMTWLGESYQEGDMALYSTHPLNNVVGPGISRCEYGGFMISYPPYRLYDVWTDEVFDFTRTKAERLLAAAIDYSLEKYIVYVAAQPPRPFFKSLAGKLHRSIIYLPLSSLSPPKLKKLRVFHVLSSHKKREIARDYIW